MTGRITEAQLREQVKILAGKFLQRTAAQVPQLCTEVERLATTGDPEALHVVQEFAHKIHGSGAMFGFRSISDLAGELQLLSVRTDEPDRATLMAIAAAMRPVLNRLADALNAALPGS